MTENVPAPRAIILWNKEITEDRMPRHGRRVTEVRVFDIRNQPHWARRLSSSRGACDADWMQGDPRSTPMGIFLMMAVAYGFVDERVKMEALREFARIEGQDVWANYLLRELGAPVDDEEEPDPEAGPSALKDVRTVRLGIVENMRRHDGEKGPAV